jgi:hypothetical protein
MIRSTLRDPLSDLAQGPQSSLERKLIKEFLLEQGYRPSDLKNLPREQARSLMVAACRYASLRLAEVESKARMREGIRGRS